jgi:cyclic pyranopterin phosphate synthase
MALTLQVVGYKNSGKTSTILDFLAVAQAKGLKTAVIKHDDHDLADLDQPKTDTSRFKAAGATTLVLQTNAELFLRQAQPASLPQLVTAVVPSDTQLVLIEGFKTAAYPKVVLMRPGDIRDSNLTNVVAQASLAKMPQTEDFRTSAKRKAWFTHWLNQRKEDFAMSEQDKLTHFNAQNRAKMVDVTNKSITSRQATAVGTIIMQPETLERIHAGKVKKGDVLAVAQVAGIMASKKTSELIPMCHLVPLTGVDISFKDNDKDAITAEVTVKTKNVTGVEMEALVACQTALLTIYDMCKAMDRGMRLTNCHLVEKMGGKSGHFIYHKQKDSE